MYKSINILNFRRLDLLLYQFILLLNFQALAQNFVNPDLDGPTGGSSLLPYDWQGIDYTYINCIASNEGWDTPDITYITGPSAATGILGNPYSGETFVSGLIGETNNGLTVFHEGIQQTVSGFEIDSIYTIHFWQTVVKQINHLDNSGSWIVYLDENLVGYSEISSSSLPYISTSLIWEERELDFIATNTAHTFYFLPYDDDDDLSFSSVNTNGALRMGIDSIYIQPKNQVNNISILEIPNVITPNGDGINDQFTPIKINNIQEMTTLILNRWGNIVYQTSDKQINWDAANIVEGVYFWRINYITISNKEEEISGFVTVIK